MIERLYLDNIRSFVNFEWKPDRLVLLLGPNGAGKTALLETLATLQAFVTGERSVSETFPDTSRTRWETRAEQTVELDVRLPSGVYRYRLVVAHDLDNPDHPLVQSESLHASGKPIVEFTRGDLRVYHQENTQNVVQEIPGARLTRSGVGAIDPGRDPILRGFQEWAGKIRLLRPDPRAMSSHIERHRVGSPPRLAANLQNFAAWYPHTLAANFRAVAEAMRAIEPALPGLIELRTQEGVLEARFEREGVTTVYSFDELSDGERLLIGLYVVLHTRALPGAVLLLDEPDNYLGLREIQPWLAELADRALRSDGPQVLLVSHHPEALNFLAPERGFRMFRDANGPTRIARFEAQEELRPAELVARGWDSAR
jgi:predicted ATPase